MIIKRENDPMTGLVNGLGIAFILWGIIFLVIAIIRWIV